MVYPCLSSGMQPEIFFWIWYGISVERKKRRKKHYLGVRKWSKISISLWIIHILVGGKHVYKWNIQNRSCQIYNFVYSMDIQVNLIHLFTTELCSFSLSNLASTLNHALWRCHKYGQTGTIYIKLRIKNLFRDERVDIQFMNWSVSLKVYVITLICREDQLNGVNERWVNGLFPTEVQKTFFSVSTSFDLMCYWLKIDREKNWLCMLQRFFPRFAKYSELLWKEFQIT